MPNLVITNSCNLRCPFCFATEYRRDAASQDAAFMTIAELRSLIDFAGVDTVRFCGGEPSLHPDFLQMVDLALAVPKRRVFIMTNGLWPAAVSRGIAQLTRRQASRITYLVNVLPKSLYDPSQWSVLRQTLSTLDARAVTIGFTIYCPAFDSTPLLDLAVDHGINRVRFSIAAPTITDSRSWTIDPTEHYPLLAQTIYQLALAARARNLRLQSDCGYVPPCMFSPTQWRELVALVESGAIAFRCDGPIDIGPGGQAWRCYGLYSALRAQVNDFENPAQLTAYFDQQTELLAGRHLFDECAACALRDRYHCGGGCHAFRAVRALKSRGFLGGQSGLDERLLSARPMINTELFRLVTHASRVVGMRQDPDGTWASLSLTPLEEQLLRSCDGMRSVAAIITTLSQAIRSPDLADQVARALRRLCERQVLDLGWPPCAGTQQ